MRPSVGQVSTMLRDSSLAFLIAVILGISLFLRVSGVVYVALVFATLLLSLLLVRQKPTRDRDATRGGKVHSFPSPTDRPAGKVRSA